MPDRDRLTASAHLTRADEHACHAEAIGSNEWAAVCYFYAAYHRVRAALLNDPVFDDLDQLHQFHLNLVPDDRYVTMHKGRGGRDNREFGVCDLVLRLYRPIAGAYDKLHMASIDVRYNTGLRGDITEISPLYEKIKTAQDGGTLVAWVPTT